jgi:aminopeptidase N
VTTCRVPGVAAAAIWACLAGAGAPAGWSQPASAHAAPASGAASPGRGALDVTPLHYQLTVTPDFGTATYDGDLTIDLRVDTPTARITLDAVDLDVYDAELLLPYERRVTPVIATDAAAGTVSFTSPARLYPGSIKLHVLFGGKLRGDGRGFYLTRARGRKYLLSQMEATDARRAFPCIDDPSVKASFAVSAVVDRRLTAISNGRLISDTPADRYGKHVLRFGTTPRMSTYLVALAVGEFGCLETTAASIPIRVCAAPERRDSGAFVLEAARRAFQFHAEYFTFKYPFRKLDLVAVPGGFPGAMENSGAIFFDEGMLIDPAGVPEAVQVDVASTISHEVAHQWLGDVVTMRWWDDLWLNEGLATWIESKAVAAWKPAWRVELGAAGSVRRAMRTDASRSARPVRAMVATEAEIEESFDEMAYDKAAAVLRMVEAWIGADVFRNALNAFVRTHAYQNATAEDLWKELATAADKPVDQVMRAFLTQPGIPLVSVVASCDGNQTTVTASVRRLTAGLVPSSPPEAPTDGAGSRPPPRPGPAAAPVPGQASGSVLAPAVAWPIPLQVRGMSPTAPMLVFSTQLIAEAPQAFTVRGCFPAVLANSGAAGYFVTAYPPAALAQLASLAASRMTPAERIRLLDDQWALAAASLAPVGDYLAVVSALAGDPTPEVLQTIAQGLTFLREHVVGEPARERFESWVRQAFGRAATALGWRAAPGETADRRRLRAAMIEVVGAAGRDAAVLATSRALALADAADAQPLDREIRSSVIRLAARTADADLLATLRTWDAAATLASAGDVAFVTRSIAEALAGENLHDAAPQWIAAGLRNPAAGAQVWELVTSRWSDVQAALGGPLALSEVVAAAGSFCDDDARDSVQRFFADKTPAIPRTLQLALERIDACRDFKLHQETALVDWLGTRSPGPP